MKLTQLIAAGVFLATAAPASAGDSRHNGGSWNGGHYHSGAWRWNGSNWAWGAPLLGAAVIGSILAAPYYGYGGYGYAPTTPTRPPSFLRSRGGARGLTARTNVDRTKMKAGEERIIRLMRETGAQLRISGIDVTRWRAGSPPWDTERNRYSRLQTGVTPLLSQKPSAYRADVIGQRVSITAARSLINERWSSRNATGAFAAGSASSKVPHEPARAPLPE